jgi:hypothetical protein
VRRVAGVRREAVRRRQRAAPLAIVGQRGGDRLPLAAEPRLGGDQLAGGRVYEFALAADQPLLQP